MKSKGSSQPTHLITPGAWQRSWKSCSGLVAACLDFPPSFVELAFVFAWSLSAAAPGCSPDVAGTSGVSAELGSALGTRVKPDACAGLPPVSRRVYALCVKLLTKAKMMSPG